MNQNNLRWEKKDNYRYLLSIMCTLIPINTYFMRSSEWFIMIFYNAECHARFFILKKSFISLFIICTSRWIFLFFIEIETPAARKLKKNQSILKIIIQYKLEEKKVFSYGFYFKIIKLLIILIFRIFLFCNFFIFRCWRF